MKIKRVTSALALGLALTACGESNADEGGDASTGSPDAGTAADAGQGTGLPSQLGAPERPARLVVPPAYDGETPLPVVFLLHGYSASGGTQDAYFRVSAAARERGLYTIIPDGTMGSDGRRFWNATDACCDFGRTGVDDVAYLTSLLDELESLAPVDTSRVYFIGHSNGGFMSHRMACEQSTRVTAIASVAGSEWADAARCAPEMPVAVLQIHGTADEVIQYEGGSIDGAGSYPGAEEIVSRWAMRDGCELTAETLASRDVDGAGEGEETAVSRYASGCEGETEAELWRIENGSHVPSVRPDFADQVLEWLLRHSR